MRRHSGSIPGDALCYPQIVEEIHAYSGSMVALIIFAPAPEIPVDLHGLLHRILREILADHDGSDQAVERLGVQPTDVHILADQFAPAGVILFGLYLLRRPRQNPALRLSQTRTDILQHQSFQCGVSENRDLREEQNDYP